VVLTWQTEVNAERMHSQERSNLVEREKGMLLDTDALKEMRDHGALVKTECPEPWKLDVAELQPEEAASRILEHAELVTMG